MPKMFLEPVPLAENAFEVGDGQAEEMSGRARAPLTPALSRRERGTLEPAQHKRVTDPAADVAAWLVSARGWEPAPLPPPVEKDLDELALLYLKASFPADVAAAYLKSGIPAAALADAPADARLLAAPVDGPKKLHYVGGGAPFAAAAATAVTTFPALRRWCPSGRSSPTGGGNRRRSWPSSKSTATWGRLPTCLDPPMTHQGRLATCPTTNRPARAFSLPPCWSIAARGSSGRSCGLREALTSSRRPKSRISSS